MECPKCGTKNEADSVFCYECGRRLLTTQGGPQIPAWLWVLAGAAVLIVLAVVGIGAMLLNRASATPTPSLAATAPTPAFPTLPPPPPTFAALAVPTVTLLPTAVIQVATPLPAATSLPPTVPANTPAAVKPTATRRITNTVTAAAPTRTKTPALAPGVYVTKVRTDPPQVTPGQPVMFYVTFQNTSGAIMPGPWLIKIFRCAAACTADELRVNQSFGETPRSMTDINPGAAELAVGPWTSGAGGCTMVAIPYYIDVLSGRTVPFVPSNGQDRYYYNFSMCQ